MQCLCEFNSNLLLAEAAFGKHASTARLKKVSKALVCMGMPCGGSLTVSIVDAQIQTAVYLLACRLVGLSLRLTKGIQIVGQVHESGHRSAKCNARSA